MDPVSPSHPPNGGAPAAAQAGANDADPPASSPVPKTSPLLPVHQLHSPSKENIEHSIPQRLPLSRDHINTGLGTALPTEQPESQERTAATAAYIDEGSDKEARKYAMADSNSVEKGDEVSYQWSGGRPGGTVTDKATDGAVTMETKRGNEVKKGGEPENPALYISRDAGHDVVKKASEVDVEEKGSGNNGDEKKDEGADEKKEENGDAKTGDKRSAEATSEGKKDEGFGAKKQKTAAEPKQNGEAPKKKGRPAKANGAGAKKDTKKKEPKKAATETGEPRRSGRNKS